MRDNLLNSTVYLSKLMFSYWLGNILHFFARSCINYIYIKVNITILPI